MTSSIRTLLVIALYLSHGETALATPVTIQFGGTITAVSGIPNVAIGDTYASQFTYDLNSMIVSFRTEDTTPFTPAIGATYTATNPRPPWTTKIRGNDFSNAVDQIYIQDPPSDFLINQEDEYIVSGTGTTYGVSLSLYDSTATALTDFFLTDTPPALFPFFIHEFQIGQGENYALGNVQYLSAVPIPSTIWLFSSAILAAARFTRNWVRPV